MLFGNRRGRPEFCINGVVLKVGHVAGVERQDLVVEAGPARLVLGNQLRLEGAMTDSRYLAKTGLIIGLPGTMHVDRQTTRFPEQQSG